MPRETPPQTPPGDARERAATPSAVAGSSVRRPARPSTGPSPGRLGVCAPSLAALTIAGSDSGGGAGVQADLRTFFAHDLLGCSAITAVTAQNTVEVRRAAALDPDLVAAQIETVLDDLPVRASKTGMLADAGVVAAVARALRGHPTRPLVIDPVITASSGARLLDAAGVDALRAELLGLATIVTPNRVEAGVLAGTPPDAPAEAIAAEIAAHAPAAWVVVTGGEGGDDDSAVDVVRAPDGEIRRLASARVATRATHGTGCTFSAAICARLAWGDDPWTALTAAKSFVTGAIGAAAPIGAGRGPVDHLWWWRRSTST